ncbi:hypothetical protein CTEN210_09266 [Chaetoceros tenuissimus]|uniref:Uncharacterized protein n=1 Tax=Chaetoceros tenuissimus TaxID=426638 RepID=A0AAD3H723_9STRA|nr:hypothetical protein CTEN210_09266 [Chaetoceros tenuissimus]
MARITSAALAILLCLTNPIETIAGTTIINSSGSLSRNSISQSSVGNGIVAVLSSPGTPSFFGQTEDVTLETGNISILSSPGATLAGTSPLAKGSGAAAAASVAGSIIVSGITESDLENGLDDTRHGHTLTAIFKGHLMSKASDEKVSLIIAVPEGADEDSVLKDVEAVFDTASTELGSDAKLDDLYNVSVECVASEADAQRVLTNASEAAAQTSIPSDVSSKIAEVYTLIDENTSEACPTETAAILACDDSFARNHRTARAKLASWKSRTARGLTVDSFGSQADQLLQKTMDSFDRDTISAAGIAGSVASYRLEVRSKLQARVESAVRDLFETQVDILSKSTLKKFNALLLRKHGKDNEGKEQFYNDNAAAVRSAAFVFDSSVEDLEVPSLSLTKAKASQEMSTQLNTALLTFPDSPAAKLKDMEKVKNAVSKQKQPKQKGEPSVDIGLDLVAMIRPDGFGNLQGFGGYQLGGNNIIVGIHNDADEPGVISQFGGKRPPFLRVQPKLKVDIEL